MNLFEEQADEPDLNEDQIARLARKQDTSLFKAARVRMPFLDTVVFWQQARNIRIEWRMSIFAMLTYSLNDDHRNMHNVGVAVGVRQANPNPNNWSAVFFEHAVPMYAIHTEGDGIVQASMVSYPGKKSAFWRFMKNYFDLAGVRVLHHGWEDW